ncbi:hypothetical protein [Streptomyces sp. Go40/10]|nr:hypothetical protein [Streptomyces sp. Go40/10]
MSTTAKAFGAHEAGQPLVPVTIERRDVGPHDVRPSTARPSPS